MRVRSHLSLRDCVRFNSSSKPHRYSSDLTFATPDAYVSPTPSNFRYSSVRRFLFHCCDHRRLLWPWVAVLMGYSNPWVWTSTPTSIAFLVTALGIQRLLVRGSMFSPHRSPTRKAVQSQADHSGLSGFSPHHADKRRDERPSAKTSRVLQNPPTRSSNIAETEGQKTGGSSTHDTNVLGGFVAVVTGGTSGIGLATVAQLAALGATVVAVGAGRTPPEVAQKAMASYLGLMSSAASRVLFECVDLADQNAVAALLGQLRTSFSKIDILVNAAGICLEEERWSKHGRLMQVETNLLGPFHLTEGLLPLLRQSPTGGRIVFVTCSYHMLLRMSHSTRQILAQTSEPATEASAGATAALDTFQVWQVYAATKLASFYHIQTLHQRRALPLHQPKGSEKGDAEAGVGARHSAQPSLPELTVVAANPGFSETGLRRHQELFTEGRWGKYVRLLWSKTAWEGSQTILRCCVDSTVVSGSAYAECRRWDASMSPKAMDEAEGNRVIRWCVKMTRPFVGGDDATSKKVASKVASKAEK